MSFIDQNSLLWKLWGAGTSRVLNDQRMSVENMAVVSNDFIKAMSMIYGPNRNDDAWKNKDTALLEKKRAYFFNYGHLSVTPRQLADVFGVDWKSDICILRCLQGDKTIEIRLDEGELIFESIMKHEKAEEVMKFLRRQELSLEDNEVVLKLLFDYGAGKNEGEKEVYNVGPSNAMKNIFTFTDEVASKYRSGNLPMQCKRKKGRKEKKEIPTFEKRFLSKKAREALQRQKTIRECLCFDWKQRGIKEDISWKNLFPYATDFFVVDWYHVLEKHLFRINCFLYDSVGAINMYRCNIKYRMMVDVLSFNPNKRFEMTSGPNWWDNWLKAYKGALEEEAKKENIDDIKKELRVELVHEHFDTLRKQRRTHPPTTWLVKNNLIDPCP